MKEFESANQYDRWWLMDFFLQKVNGWSPASIKTAVTPQKWQHKFDPLSAPHQNFMWQSHIQGQYLEKVESSNVQQARSKFSKLSSSYHHHHHHSTLIITIQPPSMSTHSVADRICPTTLLWVHYYYLYFPQLMFRKDNLIFQSYPGGKK